MAQAVDNVPYTMKEMDFDDDSLQGIGFMVYVYHEKKVIGISKNGRVKGVTVFDPLTKKIHKVKTSWFNHILNFTCIGYSYKGLIYLFSAPDKTGTYVFTLDMKKKKWTQLPTYEGMNFMMWGSAFDPEKGVMYMMNQAKYMMKLELHAMDLNSKKWSYLGTTPMDIRHFHVHFHQGDLLLFDLREKRIYGYNLELGTFDHISLNIGPPDTPISDFCSIGHDLIHVAGNSEQLFIRSMKVSTGEDEGDGPNLWTIKGTYEFLRQNTMYITVIPTENNELMVFANYGNRGEIKLFDAVNRRGRNSVYVLSFNGVTSS